MMRSTSSSTLPWKTVVRQHGVRLVSAGVGIFLTCVAIYVVGHWLTVGLMNLRHDANQVHDKNPLVFGAMSVAATTMVVIVDGFVVFAMIWVLVMYAFAVPVVLWQSAESSNSSTTSSAKTKKVTIKTTQLPSASAPLSFMDTNVELFRQVYVLARDSRPFLFFSWLVLLIPVLAIYAGCIILPWHAYTQKYDTNDSGGEDGNNNNNDATTLSERLDFVEWLWGTVTGVLAFYIPSMLLFWPIVSV